MESTLLTKIRQQISNHQNPLICFFDIDGTIFSVGTKFLNGSAYNLKTKKILDQNSIPFVLVTGRPGWNIFSELEMNLHGFPNPDAVICSAGTEIYFRKQNGKIEKNYEWSNSLLPVKFPTLKDVELEFKKKNNNLLMASVNNISTKKLFEIVSLLEEFYKTDAKIIYSESLIRKNTDDIFSGNIFITSRNAGKDGGIKYILDGLKKTKYFLTAYLFGDASIDIQMLSLKDTRNYKLHSFLVHPTPLAKFLAKKYSYIKILSENGPMEIHKVMDAGLGVNNTVQNNKARTVIKIFEPLLDQIFDKKMSADEISIFGMNQMMQGVNRAQKGKIIGSLGNYMLASITDVFDGIRARRVGIKPDGQLIDVCCDRQKEFLQLKARAEKRLVRNPSDGYQTLLSMISCILPSITRAEAEMHGITVKERDDKGGSAFDRNLLLFRSFFFDIIGSSEMSYNLDKKIYERNMATFINRQRYFINKGQKTKKNQYSYSIESRAEKRFFILSLLLQKNNLFIEEKMRPYKIISQRYNDWQKKYISNYLKVDCSTINLSGSNDLRYLLSM